MKYTYLIFALSMKLLFFKFLWGAIVAHYQNMF